MNNFLLQVKTYRSILKTFYNGKKIPLIPLLLLDHKFVTDIKAKANIFSKFFAEQCTSLKNDGKLPSNQIFLTQSTKSSHHPDIWKKSNIIPVHKKNDTQLVKNYRPISLLPIFGKLFEKIIANRIYNFLF